MRSFIILVAAGLVFIAICAWGQPTPTPDTSKAGHYVIESQAGTNGFDRFSEPPEVHFRCTKLNDHRFRFEAMDDLNAPRVEITCVDCGCGEEK